MRSTLQLFDSAKANAILKELYSRPSENPEYADIEKKYIHSFMNKSKKDLIDLMNNRDK